MINLFRQNQRILMLIVAVVLIAAFVAYYSNRSMGGGHGAGSGPIAVIYDRQLQQGDLDGQAKKFTIALALGQYDMVSMLGGGAGDENAALQQFVFNLYVLQHEAKAMGIEPTDAQVVSYIQGITAFQTGGAFDPKKYAAFLDTWLSPRGMTERHLEDVMRDALRLQSVENIIEAPVAVSDAEIMEVARGLQKVHAQYIRFDTSKAAAQIHVAPQDVAAMYDKFKSQLISPETRQVRYVEFDLPVAQAALQGHDKVEALQSLADTADKFEKSLATPGTTFDSAAKSAGLAIQASPDFTAAGATRVPQQKPGQSDDDLQKLLHTFAAPAFSLTSGQTSDVLQSGDAFYVIQLQQVTPSAPLSFEEVRPQLEQSIISGKANEALTQSAKVTIAGIRAAMTSGKSFTDAAAQAGYTAETIDGVAPYEKADSEDLHAILGPTLIMKDGQMSTFEQAPWGGFCVFLQNREPLDQAALAGKKAEYTQNILQSKRNLLFYQWLRTAVNASGLKFYSRGQQ